MFSFPLGPGVTPRPQDRPAIHRSCTLVGVARHVLGGRVAMKRGALGDPNVVDVRFPIFEWLLTGAENGTDGSKAVVCCRRAAGRAETPWLPNRRFQVNRSTAQATSPRSRSLDTSASMLLSDRYRAIKVSLKGSRADSRWRARRSRQRVRYRPAPDGEPHLSRFPKAATQSLGNPAVLHRA
jgi:hypothetical protein